MNDLPIFTPDVLTFRDGRPVSSPAAWPERRQEILSLLTEHLFGQLPPVCGPTQGEMYFREHRRICAGFAVLEEWRITAQTEKEPYTFPMHLFLPKDRPRCPAVLLINFRPDLYDRYVPAEKITRNGMAVAVINYQDITSDNGDFTNGVAPLFTRAADGTGWGKISLWAWGASRAMDVLMEHPDIDHNNIAVLGHSRLGKTALWCGANDERFRFVLGNGSGCAGAAFERVKHEGSETMAIIAQKFPYWFAGNYVAHAGDPAETLPFDQHLLLAASAPRFVAVGSGEIDYWADGYSEQLSCIGASPAWVLHGLPGYRGPKVQLRAGTASAAGCVGCHRRPGAHYLSELDWERYMAFMQKHLKTE